MPLGAKDAAMLALLALRGDVPRTTLASWLWPESDADRAANALRQRQFKLRERFNLPLVATEKTAVRLASGLQHDLVDPTPALRRDPLAANGAFLGAAPLPDLPELAAQIEAEELRWRLRLHSGLAAVAMEHQDAGRADMALRCIHRLVDEDPLRESHVRLLMCLHVRRGERGAALEAFERCKATLHALLGESPGEETVALALAIGRGEKLPQNDTMSSGLPPLPAALQHPPFTFGRDALMDEALHRLTEQGAVLLTGMPGIGKTRIFDELVQRWLPGVVCRLQAADRNTDLSLVSKLAAGLQSAVAPWPQPESVAELAWLADAGRGEPPQGPMRPERLARLVEDLLSTAHAAGFTRVAIDDLHFADVASLDVLTGLLRRRRCGVAWLLTCRDLPLPSPLQDWLAGSPDAEAALLPVPVLSPEALRAWLTALPGFNLQPRDWVPALHAHCGGHALSVLQVLRTLHSQGLLSAPCPPPQLPVPQQALTRAAIALEQGDPRAQELAFVAALAGLDFDVALARRLLGGCSTVELLVPWHRLEVLGIFRGQGFSHEMMRLAIVSAVPAALAPAIHRDIAQALLAQGTAPARRAAHWEAAGDYSTAAADEAQAGEDALAAGLLGRARERLLHAAALHDRAADPSQAFTTRLRAEQATRGALSMAEATAQARALLSQAATAVQRCQALCLLADALSEQHDTHAVAAAEQALALARQLQDEALHVAASLRLAKARRVIGLWAAALADVDALLAPVCQLMATDLIDAQTLRAQLLGNTGQRSKAVALTRVQLQQAEMAKDWYRASEHANTLVVQLSNLCRISEARELTMRGREYSVRAGYDKSMNLVDDLNLCCMCADLGRFDEAIAVGEAAVEGLRALGNDGWLISAENLLAGVFTILGRLDLAAQRLREPAASAPAWARAMRRAAQARLLTARGGDGLPGLLEAAALLQQGGAVISPDVGERLQLEQARWGDPAAAVTRSRQGLAWATANEHTAVRRLAALIEIEALLRLQHLPDAAACADAFVNEAAETAESGPCDEFYNLYPPEVWLALCRAWDSAGEHDKANTMAVYAAQWIQTCATQHVPAVFMDSFLNRNPVNVAVRRRAVTRK